MTDTETPTPDTISPQAMIDGYFRCWNTTDDRTRAAAVAATWSPEATSTDPVAAVRGHDELTAMFAGFHDTYPGHSFRQVGAPDTHHQLVRWGWEMVDPSGAVVLDGIDVAVLTDDGRISGLAGFFGASLPEADAATTG
ncbi:MAG: nuclear transport factor 2 family protein [Ilumatobacter sp.]|uniref:nuclear transport factor 2 family protein n=1 Tax=Ilumatobacter sp. TaxID=1967498 RepID=UPI0026017C64|nr:nuclear transport factor 2 family protein [Ilumatobacter sp.]MDJ0769348.1 nuclear transport factor 2 family protein [Ilumatobacter sp.]